MLRICDRAYLAVGFWLKTSYPLRPGGMEFKVMTMKMGHNRGCAATQWAELTNLTRSKPVKKTPLLQIGSQKMSANQAVSEIVHLCLNLERRPRKRPLSQLKVRRRLRLTGAEGWLAWERLLTVASS